MSNHRAGEEDFTTSLFDNAKNTLCSIFYFLTSCIGHMYLMDFGNRYAPIANVYLLVGLLLTTLPFIQSLIITIKSFCKR